MIAGLIGLFLAFLSAVFLLVGLIPLLGWMNWITSLPLAGAGLAFSRISARSPRGSFLGTAGTTLCTFIIAVALFRLYLGHGIF
ncbi:MAG: hypothetical protein ACE5IP_13330 [Terriglobia bacterium]